jgi:proteasome lid subunit RPN8/RPN11
MGSESFSSSQEPPTAPLNPESISTTAQQETHRLISRTPPYISLPTNSSLVAPISTFEKPSTLPHDFIWKDRNILQNVTQFGSDVDGFVVIVTSQAVKEIREGVRRAAPNEAFGNLMGQTYKDDQGVFTLVSGCVYTSRLNATPENFVLSAEQMNELRHTASQAHPTADFVGWTHSHGGYSSYSKVDRREQAFWTDYNVGILTFIRVGAKEPWARAYRGPSSRELLLQKTTTDVERMEHLTATSTSEKKDENISGTQRIEILHRPNWFSIGLSSLIILILLSATLVLGNMLSTVQHNIQTLTSQVSLLKNKISLLSSYTPIASTNFLWNCDVQNGIAPLKVTCNGPVGPAIKQWLWHFDDTTTQETSSVIHTYESPGTYTITLTITTSAGKQELGSLKIIVKSSPSALSATRG